MGRKARKLKAARRRAAATRDILRVINRSPDDYQPAFDAILANATRLCESPLGLLLIREPDGFHVVSQLGPRPECAEYYRTHPVPDDPELSVTSRCAAECRPIQVLDVSDHPVYHRGQEHRRLAVEVDGVRSQLTVPLVRDGEGIGVILVYRREVRAFDDEHVALLSDFAEMAVIALESVRRFKAMNESLERQTATSEILRTISRSPTDYGPVFDAILDNATRLCDAPLAFLLMRDGDAFHFVAHRGSRPEFLEFLQANPVPIDGDATLAVLSARTGVPQQLADITDSDDYRAGVSIHRVASVDLEGIRTMLFVPMMKGEQCVGLVALYRREVRAFDDSHVALASTFADQAVIAVDNVRLFQQLELRNAELAESLERQTATSEILRTISRSPTDYQPVFESILQNATRLCGAPFGTLFLVENDHLHLVANLGGHPEFIEWLQHTPLPVERQGTASEAARERVPVHTVDIADETYRAGDPIRVFTVDVGGVRTLLAVPMLKGDRAVGVIALYRQEVHAFLDSEIELVSTFADQAVIAIENVRSFQEIQARTTELTHSLERQTATSEILRIISQSPTDYQPVFETILENATHLCDAPLAQLYLIRDGGIHLVASRGSREEFLVFLRDNVRPVDRTVGAIGRAFSERRAVHAHDIAGEDLYRSGDKWRVAAVELEGTRTLVTVPMLKGDEPIGVVVLYRREVRPFEAGDVSLVETFADQAVIAIENVRSFQAVQARTAELTQSLERQTATSEILRVISRSSTDYAPVFQTILDNAIRLCKAPFGTLFMLQGSHLHVVADAGSQPAMVEHLRANPIALDESNAVTSRAVRARAPCQLTDLKDEAYQSGDPRRIAAVDRFGIRTWLGVPILKGDDVVGVIALYRQEVKPFADEDIELVRTFADQAVIAIENVRSFQAVQARTAELTQSLERQTATSEILRVISRSPSDYQPVFDTILEHATRLCRAPFGALFLVRDGQLHPVAVNGPPDFVEYWLENPISIADESSLVLGGTAREQVPKQVLDYAEVARRSGVERRIAAAELGGIRTLLGVPILKGDEVAGVILMYRQEIEAFADGEIELVSTFADQAVIAIENVRAFQAVQARTAELTRSLERQTATSEILRTISHSPTDYAPVFKTILDNALRLCGAPFGILLLVRGEHFELVAHVGTLPEYVEYVRANPIRLDNPAAVTSRAAREQIPVQVEDMMDADYASGEPVRVKTVELGGVRTLLGVPMLKGEETIGVIALFRPEVRPFADDDIELVSTFADQAVIAIENVRLFQAVESRSRALAQSVAELEALGEIAQAVSSSLDLDTVLETVIERAVELSGAHAGAVHELDESTGTLPPRAAPHLEELLELPAPRVGEGAVGRAAASRAPVQIPDITVPGAYTGVLLNALAHLQLRSVLAVPMVQDDRVLGTLVVARRTPGEFPPETVRLLRALGTQSAIAIRNAQLFREIEDKSRELEAANRHKSEFLANMSHELRTPLNAVIGFSEVLGERMFGDLNDKQAEYVGDIHDSGRHLLSLINDILDLSKIEAGAMELDVGRFAVAPALDNAVTLVKERAGRRGISLESRFDGELGEMEGDERKLKQILLNLLSNAIKFTGEGGNVTLQAGRSDATVEIAVRDTGVGISQEDQALIFEEFRQVGTDYARKVEGTGLGLTLTRRFVEMHGGTIAVESAPGEGSTFRVTLPVRFPEATP